jgi:hypothetical protein
VLFCVLHFSFMSSSPQFYCVLYSPSWPCPRSDPIELLLPRWNKLREGKCARLKRRRRREEKRTSRAPSTRNGLNWMD